MIKGGGKDIERDVLRKVISHLTDVYGNNFVKKYIELKSNSVIETKFEPSKSLNISVYIDDRDITINYLTTNYSNYSELNVKPDEDSNSIANKLLSIIQAYFDKGADRIDIYKGNKIVSSTIVIDDVEKTVDIKGYSLLGKKTVNKIHYPSPISIYK